MLETAATEGPREGQGGLNRQEKPERLTGQVKLSQGGLTILGSSQSRPTPACSPVQGSAGDTVVTGRNQEDDSRRG